MELKPPTKVRTPNGTFKTKKRTKIKLKTKEKIVTTKKIVHDRVKHKWLNIKSCGRFSSIRT